MQVATAASAPPVDIELVDQAVECQIRAGEPGPLEVLGYGEITLVLGWPSERPEAAVKRLPPFRDRRQLERYADLLARYTGALKDRGVPVVPTELRTAGTDEHPRAYLVQPLVPRERRLNMLLRDAGPQTQAALLEQLVEQVAAAVDDRIGLDAQASNWAVEGDRLACFDVSTPLMRGPDGRHELDLALFLAIYPWALRRALVPVAHSIMTQFHDPRMVLLDAASNLVKERLTGALPTLLESAAAHVKPPIEHREVMRYFARDKRLWLLMQRLRRADRVWQRAARRRPYPFLLPPPYEYGPPA